MKIIEAMRKIKENHEKINDLQKKIADHCANLSLENPPYGADTPNKINEWSQACHDLGLDNIKLLTAIARTNLATRVVITIGDNNISKTIAEWVWRRREYAAIDLKTWQSMTDRGLKDGEIRSTVPGQDPTKVNIVRHYNPALRDKKITEFKSEAHMIDGALEVVNAVTDLIEEPTQ